MDTSGRKKAGAGGSTQDGGREKKKERDQERGGGTVRALGENNAPDKNNNQPGPSSAPRLIGPDLFC